jgi:hypothetical protein
MCRLIQGMGNCRGGREICSREWLVDPTAANALALGQRYPESLKPARSRAPLGESSRDTSREASPFPRGCAPRCTSQIRSGFFLPTQVAVAVAQLFQPVPFGHPRFIRSPKIVWRGALRRAPLSVNPRG